ncbi:hypothetical protein MKW92_011418 [Papaver armeniacum]|nr:hypothetical protein MKW92_011418 [Papaver armeniacum]
MIRNLWCFGYNDEECLFDRGNFLIQLQIFSFPDFKVRVINYGFQFLTASEDVSQLLFPTWNNSIHKPFLCYPLVWKYPSKNLITKVEEMECGGSRLILPGVMNRYKILQSGYIDKVVNDWIHSTGKNEILKAISGVVLEKNNILMDIISATNVYQPALYLQGLAQFFLGFSDVEFEQCNIPLTKIICL